MTRMPIAIGRYVRPILLLAGFRPRSCWIDVGPDQLEVKMSFGFHATFPRSAVQAARVWHGRRPISIGVHGWGGRWLVNGTRENTVIIDLSPTQRARVLGFPVRLTQLLVSPEQPDDLVAAIQPANPDRDAATPW